MKFEGVRDFSIPPDELFLKLADARFLVDCVKDAEVTHREEDRAEWKMKPALSFVAGTLDTRLDMLERVPHQRLRLTLLSKGIGSSSTTEVTLLIEPHDAGARINWTGEIKELTGLLKLVPKGLISSTAKKVIDDIWTGVERRIAQ